MAKGDRAVASDFAHHPPEQGAAQRTRSGATNQPKQECFGLIVARMAERDHVSVGGRARSLEELVPGGPGGVLDRSPLASRSGGHIPAIHQDRTAQRLGHSAREPLIVGGGRAELMVEVDETGQAQSAGGVEITQDVRERDGVRSARYGGEDARVAADQAVLPDELPDAIEQLHAVLKQDSRSRSEASNLSARRLPRPR